jgi:hypothetical protein
MHQRFILFLVCGILFLPYQFLGGRTAQGQQRIRIAPANGGVELDEIRVVRWTSLGAVTEADLTNMELKLWFPAWKTQGQCFHSLLHLQSLEKIEDDTGKLLSTEKRLKQIEYLRGEVRMDEWKGFRGTGGPVARLLLEAPA